MPDIKACIRKSGSGQMMGLWLCWASGLYAFFLGNSRWIAPQPVLGLCRSRLHFEICIHCFNMWRCLSNHWMHCTLARSLADVSGLIPPSECVNVCAHCFDMNGGGAYILRSLFMLSAASPRCYVVKVIMPEKGHCLSCSGGPVVSSSSSCRHVTSAARGCQRRGRFLADFWLARPKCFCPK